MSFACGGHKGIYFADDTTLYASETNINSLNIEYPAAIVG